MLIAGGIIYRVAINIALLTERESVQPSAFSSFTTPEHSVRKRCKFTECSVVIAHIKLGRKKKKCVYGYLTC